MEPKELADEFVSAFNAGDYEKVSGYLAEEFTFSGPVPEPVDAEMYLGLTKALKGGMPDLIRWAARETWLIPVPSLRGRTPRIWISHRWVLGSFQQRESL